MSLCPTFWTVYSIDILVSPVMTSPAQPPYIGDYTIMYLIPTRRIIFRLINLSIASSTCSRS
jgi:hypothetical protein